MHEFWNIISTLTEKGVLDNQLEELWENCHKTGVSCSKSDKEKIFFKIIHNRESNRIFISRKFQLSKITAAASVIILAASLTLYLLSSTNHHKNDETKPKSIYSSDIPPGGNKAILTLSDGEIIILDSIKNGYLAQQGNTRIMKLDNGILEYNILPDKKEKVVLNTIQTPRGGEYSVLLPDGTNVLLNAESKIIFPTCFIGKARIVEFIGEAYFEVAPDVNSPFIVKTGDVEIKVLGTHFNINHYVDEKDIKVTLIEGSVKVRSANMNAETTLTPGEQAIINQSDGLRIAKADINEVLAWRNGKFQFNNSDIHSLMRQISRWYNIKVVFGDSIPEVHFGGSISRNSNLSQVLNMLEISGVRFKIEDNTIFIK